MAGFLRKMPDRRQVVLVRNPDTPNEQRLTIEASIGSTKGLFEVETPIHEGDVIELQDPREGDGLRRLMVAKVDIQEIRFRAGPRDMSHLVAIWGPPTQVRHAAVQRLGIEGLHPAVLDAASDLFTDGHFSNAIFEAFKAVEVRVRRMSGIDASGTQLMGRAFSGSPPPILIATEQGRSGDDEQEGFKLLFLGAIQGIRNPKGHEQIQQEDTQRALEYLALASLLMRRLDDAEARRRNLDG